MPASTTTYTLTTNSLGSCPTVDEVVVTVVPDFTHSLSDSIGMCGGTIVSTDLTVGSSGAPYTFEWSPATGLSGTNIQNPDINLTGNMNYVVAVTSNLGCTHLDTVSVSAVSSVSNLFLSADPPNVCPGTPTQLQISGNGSSQVLCSPVYTSGCGVNDQIDLFTFNTLYHFDNVCNGFYNYFPSSTGLTTTVMPSNTYPISMQSNPAWGQGFRVWIDYNQDGDFGDADEDVYNSGVSGTQLFSGFVTIPSNALTGTARMRVMCRYATVPVPTDHCGSTFSYGETQDYDITIGGITSGGNVVYNWSPAATLDSSNVATPIATPSVPTTYTLNVMDVSFGCTATYTVAVGIASPVAGFTYAGTGINVTFINTSVGGGANYQWTFDDVASGVNNGSTLANPSHLFTADGTYDVCLIVGTALCADTICQQITLVQPTLVCDAGLYQSYCSNPVELGGPSVALSGSGDYSYEWSPAAGLDNNTLAHPMASPAIATIYTLIVTDNVTLQTCTDQVVITPGGPFTGNLTATNVALCYGQSTTLAVNVTAGGPAYNYYWTPETYFMSFTDTATVTPYESALFTVWVMDSMGCVFADSIYISVDGGFYAEPYWAVACENDSVSVSVTGAPAGQYTVMLPYDTLEFTGDFSLMLSDTASFAYTIISTNGTGCSTQETMYYFVDSACVWPGDCDYDGLVTYADMLPISVAYFEYGPFRDNASILFEGQGASSWFQWYNGTDYKHIDTNGDGWIDDDDTLAVSLNNGLSHLRLDEALDANDSLPAISLDFVSSYLIPGNWATAYINIGTNGQLAEDLYGLAYDVFLDPAYVDLSDVSLSYNDSWLAPNGNRLNMRGAVASSGALSTAVARINHTSLNGAGTVGVLHFRLRDDVPADVLPVTVQNVVAINAVGEPLDFNESNIDTLFITGLNGLVVNDEVTVFPNPATSTISVRSATERISKAVLFNVDGRSLLAAEPASLTAVLDVASLPAGVYVLRVETATSIAFKRIIIAR
ncbi:MAG TPA: GEVED domain-containing protein [Chitinophagales bacterium]|nr:GEVED domain-containing protein [Chitinophagales bacterium]